MAATLPPSSRAKRPANTHSFCLLRASAGLAGSRRSSAPILATEAADLQALLNGSDGTRTRDLRRDRPSEERRRATTNASERVHLQALFVLTLPPLRMVEPIVQSTFGPR